jgi:hypothetical protein
MQAHSIDKPAEAVEPSTRLAIVAGSVRFHKVRAIKTEAETYDSIYELYMSDEVRKRFGKSFQ